MAEIVVDVVVIGGGFSGLACASVLKKANSAMTVTVLESRDRVGGRTCNDYVTYKDGEQERKIRVDVGGAYVGPTQDRVLRVAREVGVETYHVHSKGKMVSSMKTGELVTMTYPDGLPCSVLGAIDFNNALKTIENLAEELDADKPWEHPQADKFDDMTVQEWLDKTTWRSEAYKLLRTIVRALFCKEPSELSFLYFLWYIKSGQGVGRILDTDNGAQERKFKQGSCTICDRLASRLGDQVVQLNSAVCSVVSTEEEGVRVTTQRGSVYCARYVVVALAPTLYSRLGFSPALPSMKSQLAARCPMGSIIKTNMYFPRAFWREKGFNGVVLCDDGPVSASYDDSGPDSDHPSIMGFVLASHYGKWAKMTTEERKQAIARQYAHMFGCDEMLEPIGYIEKDWTAEEWSQGCYVAAMPPQVMTSFGSALREPVGRIHFAGTETATKWAGYMDGAIQAGERAAREILQKIAQTDGLANCDEWPSVEEPPDLVCVPRPNDGGIVKWLPGLGVVFSSLGAAAIAIILASVNRRPLLRFLMRLPLLRQLFQRLLARRL